MAILEKKNLPLNQSGTIGPFWAYIYILKFSCFKPEWSNNLIKINKKK